MKRSSWATAVGVLVLLGSGPPERARAQTSEFTRFVEVANGYRLVPNITYLRAGGRDLTSRMPPPRSRTAVVRSDGCIGTPNSTGSMWTEWS